MRKGRVLESAKRRLRAAVSSTIAGLAALALVGCVLHLIGEGSVARAQSSRPRNGTKAQCEQLCFERYVANQEACYDANCIWIIVRVSCSHPALEDCLRAALSAYNACRDECDNQSPQS